jgi:hypothetical protein
MHILIIESTDGTFQSIRTVQSLARTYCMNFRACSVDIIKFKQRCTGSLIMFSNRVGVKMHK